MRIEQVRNALFDQHQFALFSSWGHVRAGSLVFIHSPEMVSAELHSEEIEIRETLLKRRVSRILRP